MYTVVLVDSEESALSLVQGLKILDRGEISLVVVVNEEASKLVVFKKNDHRPPPLLREIRGRFGSKQTSYPENFSAYDIRIKAEGLVQKLNGLEVAVRCIPDTAGSYSSRLYQEYNKLPSPDPI